MCRLLVVDKHRGVTCRTVRGVKGGCVGVWVCCVSSSLFTGVPVGWSLRVLVYVCLCLLSLTQQQEH